MFQYSDTLPALRTIEENFDVFFDEFSIARWKQETDEIYNPIGDWRFFGFHRKGVKNEECCKLCPKTVELIESLGEVYTSGYSTLRGHKKIHRHIDDQIIQTIRVHLTLQVGINAGSKFFVEQDGKENEALWEKGKAFAFNPLLYHHGSNVSGVERVILLIDYKKLYDVL